MKNEADSRMLRKVEIELRLMTERAAKAETCVRELIELATDSDFLSSVDGNWERAVDILMGRA